LYTEAECAYPEDRLYALVNISSDPKKCKPDYRKSWQKAYLDFAYQHVGRHSLTRLLICAASKRSLSGPSTDLPSWVPDWRVSSSTHSCMLHFFEEDATSIDYEFCKGPAGLLYLEGHLMQSCAHLDSTTNDSCTSCKLPSMCGLQLGAREYPLLFLPGASVFFGVRSVEEKDAVPGYTLENCHWAGSFWSRENPRRWFKAAPVMYAIH